MSAFFLFRQIYFEILQENQLLTKIPRETPTLSLQIVLPFNPLLS